MTETESVVPKIHRPLGPFRGNMYSAGGLMGNVFDTFKKKYARRLVAAWNHTRHMTIKELEKAVEATDAILGEDND